MIIIYDATHAWHISPDLNLLPQSRRTAKHTVRFAGQRYKIYEAEHANKLWVPDRESIDLAPIAIAMPYAAGKKAYFVLGTPEFMVARKFTGESAQSKRFRGLLSGVAMHELAHT